ncbi:apoptosis-inducing factor [Acrasis kona]|uniref:Apoptosis-inducing factor n=1 Tax=Acrasis kona TaxID=1008807 RepID=A0AAW2ZS49_9EUKA
MNSTHTLSFEAVLDHEETRELFKSFLLSNRTAEVLDFIDVTDRYYSLKSDVNRYKLAQYIVTRFIGMNAECEINLSEDERVSLLATVAVSSPLHCARSIFEKTVCGITLELKQDSFKRFMCSDLLHNYIVQKKESLTSSKFELFMSQIDQYNPNLYSQHSRLNYTFSNQDDDCTESSTEEQLDALERSMKEPYTGVILGDHKLKFKHYSKCFSASDVVSWLSTKLDVERTQALTIMNSLNGQRQLFSFVRDKQQQQQHFDDDESTLLRFKDKKKIVLIGGGFANIVAARRLEEDYEVTLIDPKQHFECIPSFPLLVSEPERLSKIKYNLHHHLKHCQVLTGHAALHISDKKVMYKSNHITSSSPDTLASMDYDYLIIGSGASRVDCFPVIQQDDQGTEQRAVVINPYDCDQLQNHYHVIQSSNKVVIVGGGGMGIEISSELVCHRPDLSVVLVTKSSQLLNLDKSVSDSCMSKLTKHKNLEVMLNCEIKKIVGKTIHYETLGVSKSFCADVIIPCTGMRPNSSLCELYMPQAIDREANGSIKVNRSFQVYKGDGAYYSNIFAVGDVTNLPEFKLANLAMHHGKVVSDVINSIESGTAINKLPTYKTLIEPLVVSFGPENATLILNGKVIASNTIVRSVKYKMEDKVDMALKKNKKILSFV